MGYVGMVTQESALIKNLDFNKCMQCGECTGSCPVSSKSNLNPRRLVLEAAYINSPLTIYPPLNIQDKNEIWDCTTCSTCSTRCPREVKPMDIIIALRDILVEQGNVPSTLGDVLEGVYKYGNPWKLSRSKRSDWAQNFQLNFASEGGTINLLYYVGCAPSYDSRVQEVARAMVKNLDALGIDFSILGNKENCCGNEIQSLGEKGLFEEIIEKNLDLFNRYGVQKIVTTSPHCFNVFKNKYTESLSVKHYTQFFADLIDKKKVKFSGKIDKVIAYHDPCFLGRYNGIYDEPRKIIESIPGVKLVEFSRSRNLSVCCEGGGGRVWHDIPGKRLTDDRVKEAIDIGADIIAVACPFCLLTFDDSIKTTNSEGKIQVKDIMELVAETL
jgi:Fe-S oxidoreductase